MYVYLIFCYIEFQCGIGKCCEIIHDPSELVPTDMRRLLMFIQSDVIFHTQPRLSSLTGIYRTTLIIQHPLLLVSSKDGAS